jgi:hypothetical protein
MKGIVFCLLVLIFASCADEQDPAPIDTEELVDPIENMEVTGAVLLRGNFTGYAHALAGKVSVVEEDQKRILRFEDFVMTAGPDVYVFVSKSNVYSTGNTMAIAKLTSGYNKSTVNFELNSAVDLEAYPYVLVYCVQFSSLFGFAELK